MSLGLIVISVCVISNFPVSSCVVMKDGKEFNGVNVENASYGATLCAERNAITTAVSMGYKKGDFKKLYVMVSGDKLSTPCFICRQALADYCNSDLEIVSFNNLGDKKVFFLKDLIPNSFGDDCLK